MTFFLYPAKYINYCYIVLDGEIMKIEIEANQAELEKLADIIGNIAHRLIEREDGHEEHRRERVRHRETHFEQMHTKSNIEKPVMNGLMKVISDDQKA